MNKEEVLALQQNLAKLRLDISGIDGIYRTNDIMILQHRTGLAIDGVAGKNDLGKDCPAA